MLLELNYVVYVTAVDAGQFSIRTPRFMQFHLATRDFLVTVSANHVYVV